MDPSNADAFAGKVVDFLNTNNLDGVDFDWYEPRYMSDRRMNADQFCLM